MARPLLIGQAPGPNTERELPLFPYPPQTSTGARLMELMDLDLSGYLRTFDRMNLLYEHPGQWAPGEDRWPTALARVVAQALKTALYGREVIFLGRKVATAFGHKDAPWHTWQRHHYTLYVPGEDVPATALDFCYAVVPHPSGRNHWYNDEARREEAQAFWQEFLSPRGAVRTHGRVLSFSRGRAKA